MNQVMINLILQRVAWASCQGENPADVENIGLIKYFPERGFPEHQMSTNEGSLEPLVAVYFERPKSELDGFIRNFQFLLFLSFRVAFNLHQVQSVDSKLQRYHFIPNYARMSNDHQRNLKPNRK